jgi:flavin-dependent dehydrogenase
LLDAAAPGLREVVDASTERSRIRGWRGTAGFVRQAWGPGWALVGDAGYFKDPISTHGITDALRDADLLADAIGQATTGGADARRAMTAYQDTRDCLSRALWEATEEVAGYGWDVARSHTLVRSMSAAMSDEVDHLARLDDVGQPTVTSTPDRSGRSPVA